MALPAGVSLGALRLGAAVVVVAGAFAAGWWQGSDAVQTEHALAQAQAEREAAVRYRNAVADGEARAGALMTQLRGLQGHAATLQERLDHEVLSSTPLALVRPGRCPGIGNVRPAAATLRSVASLAGPLAAGAPVAAAAAPLAGDALGADAQAPDRADAGVQLTLGAVSVWNSALAGVDLPAGACGTAAAASGACAADAGLDLVDAWRNHVTNASACAADRARYRALIDHLKARER